MAIKIRLLPGLFRLLALTSLLALCPAWLRAQTDFSGVLSFTGYSAREGSPRAWGLLDFNPRLAWRGSDWQFKLSLHALRDSRPEIGRRRLLDPEERADFRAALQFEEFSARRVWGSGVRRELKLGLLPIRWGRTDGFTPTDTLSPLDFTDLLEARRPAVPALSFALRGEHLSWQLLSLPLFSPDRLPPGFLGKGGRFSEPLPDAVTLPGLPGPWRVHYQTRNDLPARTGRNMEWATRIDWVGSAFEAGVSYKRGFDKMAVILPALAGVDPAAQTVSIDLRRDFPRVEIYGADFLLPLGAFILRAETAWWDYQGRSAAGDNPDKLLYTLEIEHSRHDWHTILAWGDVRRHDDAPGGTLPAASGPNLAQGGLPALLLSVERRPLGEWGVKFTGIFDKARHGWLARGDYSLPLGGNFRADIGADFFGGPGDSFYGVFTAEDRARIGLTYSF
jgi:hypothetical protein